MPFKDISKALTDLKKLYNDNKFKFRGDKYQYIEIELWVFKDNYKKIRLLKHE
jgi:hypothetical protein